MTDSKLKSTLNVLKNTSVSKNNKTKFNTIKTTSYCQTIVTKLIYLFKNNFDKN